jgi:hypothetical protein
VRLAEIAPDIWRRLVVSGTYSLHDLHYAIQIAFGWELQHLYEFQLEGVTYHDPIPEDRPDGPDPRDAILGQLPVTQGTRFRYLYDFGDDWTHEVLVEGVAPQPAGFSGPLLLGGARAGPPENVGGPWGYARFLSAIQNPKAPESRELREWYGRPFDPESWNPQAVTTTFGRLSRRSTSSRPRRKK